MIVRSEGADILRYNFQDYAQASEMMLFLKEFFEDASFVIQQQRH